MEKDANDIT